MSTGPTGLTIIATTAELLVFRSVEAAEAYLEPIDVEHGEYVAAWDGAGRPLALAVIAAPNPSPLRRLTSGPEAVFVRLAYGEPDVAGLRDRIAAEFGRGGDLPPPTEAPLPTYLDALVARNGYTY